MLKGPGASPVRPSGERLACRRVSSGAGLEMPGSPDNDPGDPGDAGSHLTRAVTPAAYSAAGRPARAQAFMGLGGPQQRGEMLSWGNCGNLSGSLARSRADKD